MKQITVDEVTARAVEAALELAMRFGMGQLEYLEEVLRTESFGGEDWVLDYDAEKAVELLNTLKKEVFGHAPGGSYSARDGRIPDTFRACADVLFALRSAQGDTKYEGIPKISVRQPLVVEVEDVGDA